MNKREFMGYLNLSSTLKNSKGSQIKPSWGDIEYLLKKLKHLNGSVSLSVIDGEDVGVDFLEVRADKQHFLVTMLENTQDDDEEVRTLFFKEKQNLAQIKILGDYYDPTMITGELDLVVKIFKEFFENGNVSYDILSV